MLSEASHLRTGSVVVLLQEVPKWRNGFVCNYDVYSKLGDQKNSEVFDCAVCIPRELSSAVRRVRCKRFFTAIGVGNVAFLSIHFPWL